MAKNDRGLLLSKKDDKPSPFSYGQISTNIYKKKDGSYMMSKSGRPTSFARYSSMHNELVRKGLY